VTSIDRRTFLVWVEGPLREARARIGAFLGRS
jgi:hypothetical protein